MGGIMKKNAIALSLLLSFLICFPVARASDPRVSPLYANLLNTAHTEPANPLSGTVTLVNTCYGFWQATRDVAISGHYACALTDYFHDFVVIDVADVDHPKFVSSAPIATGWSIVAADGYCCMNVSSNVISVVDLTDPKSPEVVADIVCRDAFESMMLKEDYLYVSDQDSGFTVFNMANPSSPERVGFYNTPGRTYSMTVDGTTAYVADRDSLLIVDVSNLEHPTRLSGLEMADVIVQPVIAGDYLYAIQTNDTSSICRVHVIDVSNPESPQIVGTFEDCMLYPIDQIVSNGILYIGDNSFGIVAIDVSNPQQPTEIYRGENFSWTNGIAQYANTLYLSSFYFGLAQVDISNPEMPFEIHSRYDWDGELMRIEAADSKAFLVDHYNCFRAIDVSDPDSVYEINCYHQVDCPVDIHIENDKVYLVDDGEGISEFAITDSMFAASGRHIDVPPGASAMDIQNGIAYVGAGSALYFVDLGSSEVLGHCDLSDRVLDVIVAGKYAYVAADEDGLLIVDISDLAQSSVISFLDTPDIAFRMVKSGDIIYIADYNGGVRIANVADPTNPYEVSSVTSLGHVRDVAVDWKYLYVAGDNLYVYDVEDLAHSLQIGFFDTPSYMTGLAVDGSYVYGTTLNHAYVFDVSGVASIDRDEKSSLPGTFRIVSLYPNPFNPALNVVIYVPIKMNLQVAVYDVTGRMVKELANSGYAAGRHSFLFDGSQSASGVYFVQARMRNGEVKSGRVVLLK